MCAHDLSRLGNCWLVTLCLAICRPLRNLWLHIDSKCGHVSMLLLWHSVQVGLGYFCGQNKCFLWFPIYWVGLNFNIWVVWAMVACCGFGNGIFYG